MDELLIAGKLQLFLMPMAVTLATVFFGYILRNILFGRFSHWAGRTKTDIDNIVIDATRGPFIIWCLMLGIYFGLEISELPEQWVDIAGKVLLVLGIGSVTLVLSNISTKFMGL